MNLSSTGCSFTQPHGVWTLNGKTIAEIAAMPDNKMLLDVRELAKALSISPRTVWKLVANGELPQPIRLGRRLPRWPAIVIADWLKKKVREEGACSKAD